MQQRELRLGDILDDYCPRERRVTNHAIVAMVGPEVKQTRCTTCDAEHEYKHARVPRLRRKIEEPAALYSQVLATAPKRVGHEEAVEPPESAAPVSDGELAASGTDEAVSDADASANNVQPEHDRAPETADEPVHRTLIRATLPRIEGQAPPARPAPDFTIRQPGGGRPARFRPRHQRGGGFQGDRSNGNVAGGPGRPGRDGQQRFGSGRPQGSMNPRMGRRQDAGRKRSK